MVGKLFKVVITQKARERLLLIDNYYKINASPNVATKIREGLVKEIRSLEKLPASKPLLPTKREVNPPYRYSKKWRFKIVFQIIEDQDTVSVTDILHDKESSDKSEIDTEES